MIEGHGITIIRTNPDAANFDRNRLINQIYEHISQSNKEKLWNEIKKLKLQLANLSVENNDNHEKYT